MQHSLTNTGFLLANYHCSLSNLRAIQGNRYIYPIDEKKYFSNTQFSMVSKTSQFYTEADRNMDNEQPQFISKPHFLLLKSLLFVHHQLKTPLPPAPCSVFAGPVLRSTAAGLQTPWVFLALKCQGRQRIISSHLAGAITCQIFTDKLIIF